MGCYQLAKKGNHKLAVIVIHQNDGQPSDFSITGQENLSMVDSHDTELYVKNVTVLYNVLVIQNDPKYTITILILNALLVRMNNWLYKKT